MMAVPLDLPARIARDVGTTAPLPSVPSDNLRQTPSNSPATSGDTAARGASEDTAAGDLLGNVPESPLFTAAPADDNTSALCPAAETLVGAKSTRTANKQGNASTSSSLARIAVALARPDMNGSGGVLASTYSTTDVPTAHTAPSRITPPQPGNASVRSKDDIFDDSARRDSVSSGSSGSLMTRFGAGDAAGMSPITPSSAFLELLAETEADAARAAQGETPSTVNGETLVTPVSMGSALLYDPAEEEEVKVDEGEGVVHPIGWEQQARRKNKPEASRDKPVTARRDAPAITGNRVSCQDGQASTLTPDRSHRHPALAYTQSRLMFGPELESDRYSPQPIPAFDSQWPDHTSAREHIPVPSASLEFAIRRDASTARDTLMPYRPLFAPPLRTQTRGVLITDPFGDVFPLEDVWPAGEYGTDTPRPALSRLADIPERDFREQLVQTAVKHRGREWAHSASGFEPSLVPWAAPMGSVARSRRPRDAYPSTEPWAAYDPAHLVGHGADTTVSRSRAWNHMPVPPASSSNAAGEHPLMTPAGEDDRHAPHSSGLKDPMPWWSLPIDGPMGQADASRDAQGRTATGSAQAFSDSNSSTAGSGAGDTPPHHTQGGGALSALAPRFVPRFAPQPQRMQMSSSMHMPGYGLVGAGAGPGMGQGQMYAPTQMPGMYNDWTCPRLDCQYVNFARNRECRMCNCPRGDSSGEVRVTNHPPLGSEGDWRCTECTAINWRRRTVCYSCFPLHPTNLDCTMQQTRRQMQRQSPPGMENGLAYGAGAGAGASGFAQASLNEMMGEDAPLLGFGTM